MFVQLNELITQLHSDQIEHNQIYSTKNELLAFSVFNTNTATHEQSTTGLNGQFLHSQLLIECLIRMNPTTVDKNQLISLCKVQYKRDHIELKNICEFEQDYSPDSALRWYTRPSFLYQLLNKALRTQNIDLLFLFRFFIRDLSKQLEQYRCLSQVQTFRGQFMANDEFKMLRDAVGQFISINSFFSTTFDRNVALFFLGESNAPDGLQRVLFEIDADPCQDGIKPFASISSMSHCPGEEEVLMMIGSVFRLIDIHFNEHGLWIVRMRLCSDKDHDLKSISDHMKEQLFGIKEINLGQFGNVLRSMGKFDDAEKYYLRLLEELPHNHQDIASCYWGLGIVASNKGHYVRSLKWHKRAFNIYQQTLQANHRHIADSRTCIGSAYESQGKHKQALQSYTKALAIYQQVFGEDHHDIAVCLANIGNIHQEQKKYSKALEYHRKSLVIWQKTLPADHHRLGSINNNIATVYYSLREYDLALQYYIKSLDIKSRSLPHQHPSIANTLKNIGDVYINMSQFQLGLTKLKEAAEIYSHTLPATHPYAVNIHRSIRRASAYIR